MGDPQADLSAAVDGRYRIERELGAGGMATVYLADDLRHHRRVAIKVVRRELAAALGAERFLRVPVTDGRVDEGSPEWSPDGKRLLLLASWATHPAVHVVTRMADGRWSTPRTVRFELGADSIRPGLSDWSPDGRLLACGCGEGGIVVAPVDGGPARRLSSRFSTAGWAFPKWSADGRTVFHLTEDSSRVVAVVASPLDGGPGRVVVRFDDPTRPWHRYGFRVRAGRMFFTLGDRESDVWVADIDR